MTKKKVLKAAKTVIEALAKVVEPAAEPEVKTIEERIKDVLKRGWVGMGARVVVGGVVIQGDSAVDALVGDMLVSSVGIVGEAHAKLMKDLSEEFGAEVLPHVGGPRFTDLVFAVKAAMVGR